MRFSKEIIRGVRLAAIVFAIGLVGLTVYRMLDVDDAEDTANASTTPVAAPAPAKTAKASGPEQAYPPPPPPLPGRAVAAKPVHQGRDIVVVDVPAARESFAADASVVPSDAQPATAEDVAPVPVTPQPVAVAPPPEPHRTNRLVRSMRKLLHIGK